MGKSREHIAIPSWEGGRHGGPRAREESLTTRGGLDQEIGVAKLTKYYYSDQRTENLGRGRGVPGGAPIAHPSFWAEKFRIRSGLCQVLRVPACEGQSASALICY